MKRRTRNVIDFALFLAAVYVLVDLGGAAWWSTLVLVPVAVWNFWDGMTRADMWLREARR